MKRSLMFAIAIFVLPFMVFAHSANTKIVRLRSDKKIYAEGETAILRATFLSKPDNSNFQFDILGNLNAEPLPVDRVTDYQMFSKVKNLEPGTHTWQVLVVIQDARYARDLKASIAHYGQIIAELDAEINLETDPDVIEQLEAQKATALKKKTAAESELSRIRTPVLEPLTLQFTVEEI